MYKYHRDHVNNKWMIYKNGDYQFSVDTLEEAQRFCSINNWRPQ